MSLPINPLAKLVSDVSSSISQVTNEAGGAIANAGTEFQKANLDQKINELSGAIGTGLNGATAGFGEATTALGGIGNSVQSSVSGALNGLQSVAGSISNVTADISGALNKLGGGNLASGVMQLAGGISKAAGAINNILSLKRGFNLPSGAELFKQAGRAIVLQPGGKNDWRVRLNCDWSQFDSPWFGLLQNTGGLVFPYLPNITVSTKANYNQIDTIHNNYPFYAYKNSMVDDIQISGEFSQETETDAAYWIAATLFLKTATKMFYGTGKNAGNPPIICNLSGYGSNVFNNVPVIVKSFSVELKDDVNYITCNVFGSNTKVPILSTITITVAPLYNRERLRKFSLEDYARGKVSNGVGFL
jgi:hypothetical protein